MTTTTTTTRTTRTTRKSKKLMIFLMIGLLSTYTICQIIFLISTSTITKDYGGSSIVAVGSRRKKNIDGSSFSASSSSLSAQSRMLYEEFTQQQAKKSSKNINSTTTTFDDDSNIHKILLQQQMKMTTKTKTKSKEQQQQQQRQTTTAAALNSLSSSSSSNNSNNNNKNSTTTTTTHQSSTSTSIIVDKQDDDEKNKNNKIINFFVAIPTIPRSQNVDYLLQVLHSMDDAKFPMSQINVIYNGNPNQNKHIRYEEAKKLYSSSSSKKKHNAKFLWNDNTPLLPNKPSSYHDDPSIYNNNTSSISSIPPVIIEELFTSSTTGLLKDVHEDNKKLFKSRWLPRIIEAQTTDTIQRKNWRQKECNDFMSINQYMLSQVVVNDDSDNNSNSNSWIIFNQDDAIWQISYDDVSKLLDDAVRANNKITRYDFEMGLVSSAFRIDSLKDILSISKRHNLCDWLPIDWLLWMLDDIMPHKFQSTKSHKIRKPVKHIGQISSRQGRLTELETN